MSPIKTCSLLFLLRGDGADAEILLAMKKRGFGSGRWNGVGGKLEPEETMEQATVRECREEIGVTPRGLDKVALHLFVFPDGTPDMEVHAFISRDWTGEPAETDEMAPSWFNLADMPYADMWDDDIIWLPAVLAGQKLRTRFVFDDNEHMIRAELDIVGSL
ncbi:MAG TPA: 8-oxo-dGTP diphosphatase [Candidatus Saccharimonadales bacterium]|jgi:8-oxo-dGTP pyrophosphatase MutT (NUDIX family)